MSLDLAPPLREALLAATGISGRLATYVGLPSVFTKRPIPGNADYPLILINPAAAITDQDFLNSELPIVMRDVIAYGSQPDDFDAIEAIGYDVRALFHRQKWSITVPGYDVIHIAARGPTPGPTDDETTVARMVGLTIQLRRQ